MKDGMTQGRGIYRNTPRDWSFSHEFYKADIKIIKCIESSNTQDNSV